MATQNYVLLERIELTASAASIVFDNIPQSGYTDLKIVGSVRSDYSGQAIALRINPNGSGSNMTSKVLLGSGSAASSFSDTIAYASSDANTSTANTYNNVEWYIPNYTWSNSKSVSVDFVTETNASAAIMGISAGLWSISSPITSLNILTTAGNLMAKSSFSLYGLAAAGTTPVIAPKASGGDIVVQDGTYWYHAFLSTNAFTPNQTLSCDTLVIAGGGGSYTGPGGGGSGGGGAGGLLYSTAQSLSASTYTITVGAGGTDANGSNSQIGALTAAIGGGRGGPADTIGSVGGSGGGSGFRTPAGPAAGTSGQGNAGGNTSGSYPNFNSGGGGGAGAAGGTGGTNGGVGGAGVNTYSSWATATGTGASGYYAGGGGGMIWYTSGSPGAGGAGGGGTGANTSTNSGTSGLANTGGGAGGSAQTATSGGSGIVIIRYAMA